jgi:DNA-binding winged helix-turn-helix (wHTH) protein
LTLARPPRRHTVPDLTPAPGDRPADTPTDSPHVDEFDLVRRGDRWCALSPIEAAIVRVLLERGPRVVTRREIGARAWPAGMPAGRPVDGRLHRLRTRLAPLGIRIHSVRRRGLLLVVDPPPAR